MPGDEYFAAGGVVPGMSGKDEDIELFPSWLGTGCYIPNAKRLGIVKLQLDRDLDYLWDMRD